MLSHGCGVQNRQVVAPCDIEQIVYRKSLRTCAVMCKWTDKKSKLEVVDEDTNKHTHLTSVSRSVGTAD